MAGTTMKFWGIEVKSGDAVKVEPSKGKLLHISQACLGDIKKDKGNECFRLFATKDGKKLVIAILSPEKFSHVNLDLVFEDEFELSHEAKHGSVHFAGYEVQEPPEPLSDDESDDDLEETFPIEALNSGKPDANATNPNSSGAEPEKAKGKPKVQIVEPNKDAKDEDDDDSEDDEDDDEDDEFDEDEDMPSAEVGSDEDDSDDDDSDEDDDSDDGEESHEETPEKPLPSKKRPAESTSKVPAVEKKARFSTPEKKADGKKASGHVATPHPAKHAAKLPANAGKDDKQASKSGGSFACSSCSRSFGSQQALDSHSKAKHSSN